MCRCRTSNTGALLKSKLNDLPESATTPNWLPMLGCPPSTPAAVLQGR